MNNTPAHIVVSTTRSIADSIFESDHYSPDHPLRAMNFLVLDEVLLICYEQHLFNECSNKLA
jgi:hypothetical protein